MLIYDIADYAVAERTRALPAEAIHWAKRAVIDWCATTAPASARATPNSPWTIGNTTTTDHIPTPPMVDINNATTSRVHAYTESTPAESR